ncbi:helix-turn-helix domain-containing protein [Nocardia sp. NBC_01009]|uniref:helix-turn-helix domain-containing protein n=1 Tax=Nocardia sp. NBC_01009 TaxID=2975996 RepID=UPI00386306C4|nr:helix-turn-helix domain-containing protein [Nocardia sp. NBC_01009]
MPARPHLPRSTAYRILEQLTRLRWVDRTAAVVAAAAIYQWVDLPIMRRFAHGRPRQPIQQSA